MSLSHSHDHVTNTARLPTPDKRNRPPFSLGHLVATAGVHAHLINNGINPTPFIRQHHCGLWGDVPPEDAKKRLFCPERLESVVQLSDGRRTCLDHHQSRQIVNNIVDVPRVLILKMAN